jgi:hypothetical protein
MMEATYILIYAPENGGGLEYVGPFTGLKEARDYRKATLPNIEDFRIQLIRSPY